MGIGSGKIQSMECELPARAIIMIGTIIGAITAAHVLSLLPRQKIRHISMQDHLRHVRKLFGHLLIEDIVHGYWFPFGPVRNILVTRMMRRKLTIRHDFSIDLFFILPD